MEEIAPASEDDVREAIQAAIGAQRPLEILGEGTRRGFGRPVEASAVLSTRRLAGVTLYEPAELVLSARAGTPLRDILDLLERNGQELAFEPIDHARFYGEASGGGTIGGVVAVNACGPRRIKAGAARDHLLGFRCVTGRGDVVKSGGRVMKNVTGYDLSKLVTGSHGTLAVLTEVTLKVLPKAETEQTVLFSAETESAGLAILREASGLPFDVSSFALLPSLRTGAPTAALRVEGPGISVDCRRDDLIAYLDGPGAAIHVLDEAQSRALWRDLRDAEPVRTVAGQIWRISVAPGDGGDIVATLRESRAPIVSYLYDWAGGLVWIGLEPAPDAHAGAIRAAVDAVGGHATLMRAEAQVRAAVPVFHPQPAALAALTKRVKQSFDPLFLLNRGRMRADF
ncbi:MAG TPA: FAD-binding protein [Beijerinckiaceae bacterium]|nr:FAD-binding protein [Beijerinckiaceae bacterium]